MKRLVGLACFVLAVVAVPVAAQRRPVLPGIDEPHPYYYRELYLPQLTSGPSSFAWAPDSEELIYSMAGSLWRQKLDSKVASEVTDGAGYDYQPDWSPDGKAVVYVSYQKDAMELWYLDLPTGKTHALTAGGAVNVEPRWSPDGQKILWVSTEYNKHFHIFVADVIHGELKNKSRLTGETKSPLPRYYYSQFDIEINPTWTRDGKEILFVSNKGHIYGTGGFWRMKAEPAAEAREIHYEETSWKARPEFSPDGSRIVYSSYLGRQWHSLWLVPGTGGDAFPISYSEWDESNPRWSPDGKKIAAISNQSGRTELFWQELPSGQRSNLTIAERVYLQPRSELTLNINRGPWLIEACRVSVTGTNGLFYSPSDEAIYADDGFDRNERHFERHYFYASGETSVAVPAGKYLVEVSRGFTEKPIEREVQVRDSQTAKIEVTLERIELPSSDGQWVSADLHVHMNYGGTYRDSVTALQRQAVGEGLNIVNELIVNKEQRFPDIAFTPPLQLNDLGDFEVELVKGQEFHTSYWGHRGILGLQDHLLLPGYAGYPDTAASSLLPMNADVYDMAKRQGALVGAVHPFDELPDPQAKPGERITDELPVDVALGKLDYMEIVGFSDHKSTAAVWYKLLNLGFQIPAGAGTDATADYAAPIRGMVGQDRVYINVPGWPSPTATWMDGLKNGKTFASNGPLLEFKLGGQMVGGELKFDAARTEVPFTATLRSIVPVDHFEIVCNGKIAKELGPTLARVSADITGTIPINQSGWCVLRAWSEKAVYPVMDNYTYATTSPVYIQIAGKRAYSKEDAQYFIAWINRTIEITDQYPDWNSAEEKQLVMKRLRNSRDVYERLQ
ncbi:MAG TPA: CehA/McbA family metallohydrolase [Candidatus Acidoferrum sp.]|nr:CehA/McbA family metallohydrolase [Candidatus Acidoferrum sp.]